MRRKGLWRGLLAWVVAASVGYLVMDADQAWAACGEGTSDGVSPVVANVELGESPVPANGWIEVVAHATDDGAVCEAAVRLDDGSWEALFAADGSFGDVSEDVTGTIQAPAYSSAAHSLCVRAVDSGALPSADACTTFNVVPSYEVSVSIAGSTGAEMKVESVPVGLACTESCSDYLPAEAQVTFKASSGGEWHFSYWGECPAPRFLECDAELSAPTTIGAHFQKDSALGDGRIYFGGESGYPSSDPNAPCYYLPVVVSAEPDGGSRKDVSRWNEHPLPPCEEGLNYYAGALSPDAYFTVDGSRFFYPSYGAGSRLGHHSSVWTADSEGRGRIELSPDPYRYNATPLGVSPDGAWVLANTDEGLVSFPVDGSARARMQLSMGNAPAGPGPPFAVSPDGTLLAAVVSAPVCFGGDYGMNQDQVWVYDLDFEAATITNPRRLLDGENLISTVRTLGWSADGTTVLLSRFGGLRYADAITTACGALPFSPLTRNEIRAIDLASDVSHVLFSQDDGERVDNSPFGCAIYSPSGAKLALGGSIVDLKTGAIYKYGAVDATCPAWQPVLGDAAPTFDLGDKATWFNPDPQASSDVSDTSGFSLFNQSLDPLSGTYYEYPAAGTYTFDSSAALETNAYVEVAPTAEVVAATAQLSFDGRRAFTGLAESADLSGPTDINLVWASASAPGSAVFDVQRRASGDATWVTLATETSERSRTFTQDAGTYLYRTRMKVGGVTSGWSAPVSCDARGCPAGMPAYGLAVIKEGSGSGVVRSSPAGISCGLLCASTFGAATSVTLTATAAAGSTFVGWTGACSGTSSSCAVPLTEFDVASVIATFILTPSISAVSPTSGGVGTSVLISGEGFAAPAICTFNTTIAAPCQVLDPTKIVTSVPAGATTGVIRVSVTGVNAVSSATFGVAARKTVPTVSSFSPSAAAAGTVLVITGTNLAGALSVKVGTTSVSSGWTVLSTTQLSIPVPVGATSGSIAVSTAGGTGASQTSLTVYLPPTVASISPSSQIAGLPIMLTGANFTGLSAVSFNGTPASFALVSATSVSAVVPQGSTAGPVVVTNPAGSASSETFTPIRYAATQVSVGTSHSCARVSDGTLRCWGLNSNGQLGDNTTIQRATSVAVQATAGVALTGASYVAAGGAFTCVVFSPGASGTVKCWGQNSSGQVGIGVASNTNILSPTSVTTIANGAVGTLTGVVGVALGNAHACALMNDKTVRCWGLNTSGQLGDSTTTQRTRAVAVVGPGSTATLTGVSQVMARGSTTCALQSSGTAYCWGSNSNGQVGDASTTNRSRPTQVLGLAAGVKAIALGGAHGCAVLTGQVRCWGLNSSGQLGDGTTAQRSTPVPVVTGPGSPPPVLRGVSSISAGSTFTCALMSDGSMRCWGANLNGQLGNNSTVSTHYPVAVLAGTSGLGNIGGVVGLSCGGAHVIVIASGALFAWGLNANAQLGDNTMAQRLVPTRVLGF